MARSRRDTRIRRHLRLHGDVGAALEPRARGCRGSNGRDELDLLGTPREGVRARRWPAQVRRRRAPAPLRGRPARRARGAGGVRNAADLAVDRAPAHVGGNRPAADARRAPHGPFPVLPRRRLASGAARHRAGREPNGRDGGRLRSRRDPRQPGDRRGARPVDAWRREGGRATSAGSPGGVGFARTVTGSRWATDRDCSACASARAAARGRTVRRRAPPRRNRIRPLLGYRRDHHDRGRGRRRRGG